MGHIISRSSKIDKIENRFIVLKKANKLQGNMLPLEYIKTLKDKKQLDDYMKKIKKAKGKKHALLVLPSRFSEKYNELVKDLQEVAINDTRYISRIIINWLATELIKRDYIINNYKLIDGKQKKYKNNKEAYRKWWEEKRKEMYLFRINQISGLTTSIIRKTFLFPPPSSFNKHEGTGEGAWGFYNKEKIKELTEWDHAIDGIALSLIHSKPALFFYEAYSNALRVYFDWMHKIRKEKNVTTRLTMKNYLIREIEDEIKKGIFVALEKYHIYKKDWSSWISIIDDNFDNIILKINEVDLEKDKNFVIYRPDISRPTKEEEIKKIIDIIPVKLKWFKINEVSYNILQQLIETDNVKAKKYIQDKDEMLQILKTYVKTKNQHSEFWLKVKTKDTIEKRTYIFFRPLFHLFNREYAINKEQTINKVKIFLETVIKYVYDEDKGKVRRMDSVAEFFLNYKNASLINEKQKKIIEDFIYAKKLLNIYLSFTKDLYVDHLDLNPRKVIKYVYDGKIRSMRKLVSSENPLRLKCKKIKSEMTAKEKKQIKTDNDISSLEGIIAKINVQNPKQKFLSIKKEIKELRSNYNLENHQKLNYKLNKYKCMIDKNGSLWPLNVYIGFVFVKDGTRKPITSFDFNEMIKQGKKVADNNKGEKLILFNREVYLKNNKELKNYPVIMKSMQDAVKKSVRIKLNGVMGKALKGSRWEKQIGFRMFAGGDKFWNAENLEEKYIAVKFNGNIKVN